MTIADTTGRLLIALISPTDNGYLTIIMFDYDNHIYTFKMFNGEILDMMKD